LTHFAVVRAQSARSAAPEATMSERVDSLPLSSFIEGERRARIKRTLVIEACLRGTLHTFSEWLRVVAVRSARVLHELAARRCLRRAIRELHRLDDRTLRDIGVTRGEIESAVREGLPMRPLRKPWQHDWHAASRERTA
jgi:uncharacterized protein YjiS (DUF1127 family)